jgi:putative Holliday junction resolvase
MEYTLHMRLLGIDFGSKRIGMALSDPGRQFAMPLKVITSTKDTLTDILNIAKDNEIKEIVIGESKNYKGEANTILADTLKLKTELEKEGYVVYLEPEFMTSANAERFQGKNDLLDASAAALILQSFLDKERVKG